MINGRWSIRLPNSNGLSDPWFKSSVSSRDTRSCCVLTLQTCWGWDSNVLGMGHSVLLQHRSIIQKPVQICMAMLTERSSSRHKSWPFQWLGMSFLFGIQTIHHHQTIGSISGQSLDHRSKSGGQKLSSKVWVKPKIISADGSSSSRAAVKTSIQTKCLAGKSSGPCWRIRPLVPGEWIAWQDNSLAILPRQSQHRYWIVWL